MFRHLAAAAAVTISLSACTTTDSSSAPSAAMASPGDMTPESATAFVAMAASGDMYEIQSSQLAQSRAQNPALRPFADMLIQHHTQTTQQLMAAAQSAGVPVPTSMLPMHADMLQQLQAASGAEFDRLYRRQQVMAHEQAVALHSNYAARGDNPALSQVASAATPIVRGHLEQARQLPS